MAKRNKVLEEYIENYWLGLGDTTQIKVVENILRLPIPYQDYPHLHLINLIRQPENFYFTCKYLLGIDLLPFQVVTLQEMWNHRFPMLICSRGFSKTFLLAVYCLLKSLLSQGIRIVVTGSNFRQAKFVLNYMHNIWQGAPILRDICGVGVRSEMQGQRIDIDRVLFRIGQSLTTGIPLGHDGSKVRGERGQVIICDEFSSVDREVFETVIAGFAAVSQNPVDKVKFRARKKALEAVNVNTDDMILPTGNQIIISGSAHYAFNHFCEYFKKYRDIICSRGDKKILKTLLGDDTRDDFNWKDYCVIRVPYDLLPIGYLDPEIIERARATVTESVFVNEYGACFSKDSNGFFKRSLIERCVTKQPIELQSGLVQFEPTLFGDPSLRYVFGVDPASESDNFSIVVLEVHTDHRRLVYAWSTNKKRQKELIKKGLIKQYDFYAYCVRKIRDLMKVFPCERLMLDGQGGGVAIREGLHDQDKIEKGEFPIWEIVEADKEKDTDGMRGLHILEIVQFTRAEWVWEANHGLKKDFEDSQLLFPFHDELSVILAEIKDGEREVDSLADCVLEIEETKNELETIVQTRIGDRDRWSTPDVKLPGMKKGRLRKDRYSALLMANMGARQAFRTLPKPEYKPVGGFAKKTQKEKTGKSENLYIARPDAAWFTDAINAMGDNYGTAVRR